MAKRFIDTDLFKKRFVRSLPAAYKLFWVYLFCECDYAGIWEADVEVAELYCGQKISLEEIKKILKGKLHFFDGESKAFIPDFISFQYGSELNRNNPAHRSVMARLEKYNLLPILNKGLSVEPASPYAGATEQAQSPVVERKQRATFQKPTFEEVEAYCLERKNDIDPQVWTDFYTANGWKVGKNPMKDWMAAVRTWERNGINTKNNGRKGETNGSAKGGLGEVQSNTSKTGFSSTI